MARLLEGVDLGLDEFGLDAYREVGPGAHFLGCAHTLARYRTAFRDSPLADKQSFEQWRDGGARDAARRANAAWKDMLGAYEGPPLDAGVDEALKDYMVRRKSVLPDGVA
jgi:trimethylamine--corrinoid protein Co-methyltransferase